MIALLLAAQLAAGMPVDPIVSAPARSFVVRVYPPTRRCQGSARFQTSAPAAEPALLLRPQDRITARKLKDMPPATACLTASALAAAR